MTDFERTVLEIMGGQEISGSVLREQLAAKGFKGTAPSFYLLMSKMVDQGFVKAFDREETIDGVPIKLRWFSKPTTESQPKHQ